MAGVSERLQFILDLVGGEGVVGELQRVGTTGVAAQTGVASKARETEAALARTGAAGSSAGAAIEAGAARATSPLGRLSDRLGVTEGTLRTGIATAAAVGFGVLIDKAGEAVEAYVSLAGEVRDFQRVSGASAETSSRFVAVLDDLQISAEAGSAAIGKLARVDPAKLASFGIEVAHAADGTTDLTETLLNVADAYSRTEDPQQRALLGAAAFGRSYQTLIPLLEQGRQGLQEYFDGVSDGQTLTQEQLDSTRQYERAIDNLQDSIGDLALAAGEKLVPLLTSLANGAANLVTLFDAIPGPITDAGLAMIGFAIAATAGSRAISVLRGSGASKAAAEVTELGTASATAGAQVEAGAVKANRSVGGLAGKAGLVGLFVSTVYGAVTAVHDLVIEAPNVDRLATSLQALGETGSSGGLFSDLGGIEGFRSALAEVATTKPPSFSPDFINNLAFSQAASDVSAYDDALAQLVSGGQQDQAAAAFAQLTEHADAAGISTDELAALFPNYTGAVEDADLAQQSAAASSSDMAEATDRARSVFDNASGAVAQLRAEIDGLNGNSTNLETANLDMRDSLAEFGRAVHENAAALDDYAFSLDTTTQTGRDNERALLDQIQAASDYAAAVVQQTGSTNDGRIAFTNQIEAIRANALAIGLNADEVNALIQQYAQTPRSVTTKVVTDTDAAEAKLEALGAHLRDIDGRTATTYVTTKTFDQTGGTPHKATGGAVPAGQDTVVGEVRPELFRPAVAGTVIPNTGASPGSGSGGGGGSVSVTVQRMDVRRSSDIYEVADELAWLARMAGR